MTHAELVCCACCWLSSKHRCRPVFAEFQHVYSDEMPDAIGWTRRLTHVVECKVSRNDFLADRKKTHVRAGNSIGHRRWYLTPSKLVRSDEALLEGHGLLYATSRGIRVVKKAPPRMPSSTAVREEIDILRQAVLRHVRRQPWKASEYRFGAIE